MSVDSLIEKGYAIRLAPTTDWFQTLFTLPEAEAYKKNLLDPIQLCDVSATTGALKEALHRQRHYVVNWSDVMASFPVSFDTPAEASNPEASSPKIEIRLRSTITVENQPWFDTSCILSIEARQFDELARGTVAQVASNFNAAEVASPHGSMTTGKYLTHLMLDSTQGPSAAASALFGSMKRIHDYQCGAETMPDLLSHPDLEKSIAPFKKGCKLIIPRSQKNIPNISHEQLSVFVVEATPACFSRAAGMPIYFFNNRDSKVPLVTQVMTSAPMLSDRHLKMSADLKTFVREFLIASYAMTYAIASLKKARFLVLTLIGGGVFNVPLEMIMDVIRLVHSKMSSFLQPDIKIVLPIYAPGDTGRMCKWLAHDDTTPTIFETVEYSDDGEPK
jgi:hypothetical protein